ncbi:MAG: hypothetical protein M1834_002181 [Cirrosporium novae-zelandiae]|nr:MAG: hypothetical protein M1834_002181 [Cirrosporium novae-zelandiae]
MPLIILTGYPSSGKTYRANQLLDLLSKHLAENPLHPQLIPHHISDTHLGISRDTYRDTRRKEKDARAAFTSAIKKALGKGTFVIADGMNYIKGWRYQAWCEAKAAGTSCCVIHVGTSIDTCRANNKQLLSETDKDGGYPDDVFEELIMRYEEPNGMNRWDSPLFTVLYDDREPPFEKIWEALMGKEGKGVAIRQHQATVLKPAASEDYLYILDRTTSDITSQILAYQNDHPSEGGSQISFLDVKEAVELPANVVTLPQLQRLRRQFIQLNRGTPIGKKMIGETFVGFLNTSFS